MPREERSSGDVPLQPSEAGEESGPVLADEVIATYVAEAVRGIKGIADLHGSPMQELSARVHVEVPAPGVVIRRAGPRSVEAEVHVRVYWGAVIPDLARAVQEQVTRRIESLLDLEMRSVTLFVDEIEAPGEHAQ